MRLATLLAPLILLALGCSGDPKPEAAEPEPAAAAAHEHGDHQHDAPPADGEAWTCSMHPEVRMHEAGSCPKCKMNLVKEGAAAEAGADGEMAYFCPMHPEVRSHEEGRCGECNMFLVKKGDEASHGAMKHEDGMKHDGEHKGH
jgi:membrane fusion protein, copper/silver efflux system